MALIPAGCLFEHRKTPGVRGPELTAYQLGASLITQVAPLASQLIEQHIIAEALDIFDRQVIGVVLYCVKH